MEYDNKQDENVFTKKIKAGKKRTYFIDVKPARNNDYYISITESLKRFDGDGYDRFKVFLYKEDFNKFLKALSETVEHIKTELMPDYDFTTFDRPLDESVNNQEIADLGNSIDTTPTSKYNQYDNSDSEERL